MLGLPASGSKIARIKKQKFPGRVNFSGQLYKRDGSVSSFCNAQYLHEILKMSVKNKLNSRKKRKNTITVYRKFPI